MDEACASELALATADAELHAARLHTQPVAGTTLVYLETTFPAKASLLLSPALRDVVGT